MVTLLMPESTRQWHGSPPGFNISHFSARDWTELGLLNPSRLGCRPFGRKPEGRSYARSGGDVPGETLSLGKILEGALCNR
jgi:hypothetical protein